MARYSLQNQAEAHYKGHKHARKLKALEALKNKQKAAAAAKEDNVTQPLHNLDDIISEPEKTG